VPKSFFEIEIQVKAMPHSLPAFSSKLRLPAVLFAALASLPVCSILHAAENVPVRESADRAGDLQTARDLTLRLTTDLGSVKIIALAPNAAPSVHYSVHIETDARGAQAQKLLAAYTLTAVSNTVGVTINGALPKLHRRDSSNAQFWVQFVVTVPASYNVQITSGTGDLESGDIGGRALLSTQAGNIHTGKIGFSAALPPNDHLVAKFETQGGHITVADVAGDLDASTAGGHIQAGNITGSAKLHTGGGHIRAGKIRGIAHIDTDGGNITVGEADAYVAVSTGGGQIDFGEAHGSIHAQTAGGGIRVMYVAGPMEVAANGGAICLTRVTNTIRAATGDGTITAWISPEGRDPQLPVRLPGFSQLASGTGDIIVFLPRNIAANIDATVESGGIRRIEADPALALNVQARPDGQVHALGALNGGGAVLRLHSTTGKIRMQYLDADTSLRESLQKEQKMRIAQKLGEGGLEQIRMNSQVHDVQIGGSSSDPNAPSDDSWMNWLEATFLGHVRQDAGEFKKHLVYSPLPEYPQLAQRAGVQGKVLVQVRMKTDGSLSVAKVLKGEPALVEAASAAVWQWRGNPAEVDGKKVEVVSTVTFDFQLH
jgi:TonB family protein